MDETSEVMVTERKTRRQDILTATLGILGVVLAAHALLWGNEPGLGYGLFCVVLLFLIPAIHGLRRELRSYLPFAGLVLVSAAQSARFFSLSNFLTLSCLLLIVAGGSWYSRIREHWRRWGEMGLAYLRPLGLLLALLEMKVPRRVEAIRQWLLVGAPVLLVLFVFTVLLSSGNSILGNTVEAAIDWAEDALAALLYLETGEVVFLGLVACVTLPLFVPPHPTRILARSAEYLDDSTLAGSRVRHLQWALGLVLLNVLFLSTNGIDAVYLWARREIPEGVRASAYLHEGVYALIATTLLSAAFMALLLQHPDNIRRDRWIRAGAYAWMVQNVVLISGGWLRLWLYVDQMGYTMKRVHVAMFLLLVMGGYALLAWTYLKGRSVRWLLGANCVLLFAFFAVQQFIDVQGFVVRRNLARFEAGDWQFTDEGRFVSSVGTWALPLLTQIHDSPRATDEEREYAIERLRALYVHSVPRWRDEVSSLGYQARTAANLRWFDEWLLGQPRIRRCR